MNTVIKVFELAARFLKRLSLFATEQLSETLALRGDQIRGFEQELASIFGRGVRPFIERGFGGINRATSVLSAPFRRGINDIAVRRISYLINIALDRLTRLPS